MGSVYTPRWSGIVSAKTQNKALGPTPTPAPYGSGGGDVVISLEAEDGALMHSCVFGVDCDEDWFFIEYEIRAYLGPAQTVLYSNFLGVDVVQNTGVGPETGRVQGFLPTVAGRPATKYELRLNPATVQVFSGQFTGVGWGDCPPNLTNDRAQRIVTQPHAQRGQRFSLTVQLSATPQVLLSPLPDNRPLMVTGLTVGQTNPPVGLTALQLQKTTGTVAARIVNDGVSRHYDYNASPIFFEPGVGIQAVVGDVAQLWQVGLYGYIE